MSATSIGLTWQFCIPYSVLHRSGRPTGVAALGARKVLGLGDGAPKPIGTDQAMRNLKA
jgi:hypothetical protein